MRPPLRSLLLFGLLPLALAACGGGGGGGGTSSATTAQTTTSAAHQTKQVTIRVTSVVTSTKAHQRVPKRTSAGDRVEFKDRLLNASAGQFGKSSNEQVGTDTGTMTFTSKSTARLEGVATLPDGNIHFSGEVTVLPNNSITVPVVGGTGKYENASGTLLVGAGSKRSPNTYHLVIAGVPGPVA